MQSAKMNPSVSSSCHSSATSTRSKKLSGSKNTPKKCINPFDVGFEKLQGSYFSPNVFACKSSSKVKDENQSFRWSIDQLASLRPTDIDESSHQDAHGLDSENEELAQTAISEFFSKNKVAPSPWTSESKIESSIPQPHHHVTFSPHLASTAYFERYEEVLNSSKNETEDATKQTASAQTVLTIPPNLDLEKIIAQFYTFTENQQTKNIKCEFEIPDDIKEMNNCLSLRRKLFDHNDDKNEERDSRFMYKPDRPVNTESPPISPLPIRTPPRQLKSSEDHFNTPGSSSPITPCFERRLSGNFPSHNVISPVVSPIAKSAFKTPSTGSLQNEGVFRMPSTPSSHEFTPKKGNMSFLRNDSEQQFIDQKEIESVATDENSYFMSPSLNENRTNVTNQFELMSTNFSKSNVSRLQTDNMEYCDDHDTGYSTQPSSINDKTTASFKNNCQDMKYLLNRSDMDDFTRSSKVIKITHDNDPSSVTCEVKRFGDNMKYS